MVALGLRVSDATKLLISSVDRPISCRHAARTTALGSSSACSYGVHTEKDLQAPVLLALTWKSTEASRAPGGPVMSKDVTLTEHRWLKWTSTVAVSARAPDMFQVAALETPDARAMSAATWTRPMFSTDGPTTRRSRRFAIGGARNAVARDDDALAAPDTDDAAAADAANAADAAADAASNDTFVFATARGQLASYTIEFRELRESHSEFTLKRAAPAARDPEAATSELAADVAAVADAIRLTSVVLEEGGLYVVEGAVDVASLSARRACRAVAASLLFAQPRALQEPFTKFFKRDTSSDNQGVAYRDRAQQLDAGRPWTVAAASDREAGGEHDVEIYELIVGTPSFRVSTTRRTAAPDDEVIAVGTPSSSAGVQAAFKFSSSDDGGGGGTHYARFFAASADAAT